MKAQAILTLVTLTLLAGRSSAGSLDKARLRELAELPKVSVSFGMHFSSLFGFSFDSEKPDVPAEIARVRKQLKGDPSDVEHYLRLGGLYSRAKQEKESQGAYAQAVAICRQQVREHPDDMSWLARLGGALDTIGEIKEGEKLLRQAVGKAPREWRAWLGLAVCVDNLGYRAVVGDKHVSFSLNDAKLVFPALSELEPTAKQIAEMRRLWTEARDSYDRAIELAPFETTPYFCRIDSNWIHGIFEAGLRMIEGEKVNLVAMLFNPECAADMSRIARLEPHNPKTIGTAVIVELLVFAIHGESKTQGNLFSFENYFDARFRSTVELLPAESQKPVRWGLERLEQLTKNPDKTTAAAASEMLADVLMVLDRMDEERGKFPSLAFQGEQYNTAKVRRHLRRAVQLDPSRDRAWDVLTGLLAKEKRIDEAITLARERVKTKDNAHNRFFLAKTLAEAKQFDKTAEQLRAGIKDDSKDLNCRLGLIAVLLKRDEAGSLKQAGQQLDALASEIKQENGKSRERSYLLLRGIHAALSDHPARANELFRQILRNHKDETTAAQALAALGEPLTQADSQLAIRYLSERGALIRESFHKPAVVEEISFFGDKATDEDLFFLTPFRQLRMLKLSGDAFTDAGLTHLKHLPALEWLSIDSSKITDKGLGQLKSLKKLQVLWLSGTQITDAGLAQLACFAELETLSINSSSLLRTNASFVTDAGLVHLGKLPKLRELSLDSPITDKGLAELAELTQLHELRLYDNKLTDGGMKHLERLTHLEKLWLSGADISDAGVAHLQGLRKLRELDLASTKITDAGLAYLKELSQLEELGLQNTAITDAGLVHLSALTNLRSLDLQGRDRETDTLMGQLPSKDRPAKEQITGTGLKHLQRLTKLTKLDLDGRPITDAGLSAIEKLSQIEFLSLGGTNVTDAGLPHLRRLKKLDYLNVDRTKVTSQGIAELRKVLPKLKVLR